MSTKKEMLEKTFADTPDLKRRIYYTLTQDKNLHSRMTAKALSLLMAKLREKKVINDDEIEDILWDVVEYQVAQVEATNVPAVENSLAKK